MHYVILIAIVAMLSFSPWVGAQSVEGTAEPQAPAIQPEPPAPDPMVVTPEPEPVPVEPAPVVTVPIAEPTAPDVPDVPVIAEPVAPVTDTLVEPLPTEPEAVVTPAQPEIVPTATSPPAVDPTSPIEPTIVPTPYVEPTASAVLTDTGASTPAITPSPTPVPPIITWSQPDAVSCSALSGNGQALAVGDTATWRCQATLTVDVTGEPPDDLHILWQVGASYAGDDVLLSPSEGSTDTVHLPDSSPGGSNESVTFRTNWSDGQALTFDVTVARTSCAVGESPLALSAVVEVKTDDETVQIIHSGANPADAQLVSVAAPNPEVPTLEIQPVTFGAIPWNGQSWGTAEATVVIDVSNDGCATSVEHEILVNAIAVEPGVQPVIANVTASSGDIYPVAPGSTGQTSAIVAVIPAGFQGSGQVVMTFELTPEPNVTPGGYTMQFEANVTETP